MSDMAIPSMQALTRWIEAVFRKGGLSPRHAAALARVIAAGERDGCKSLGVYRAEGCLRGLKAGKVSPDVEPVLHDDGSAVLRVSAGGAFSCAGFEPGAPALAERAKKLGPAAVS